MSAKLEIKRSISPPNLWHWVIIINDNQEWVISKKSFTTPERCLMDAGINGIPQLKNVDDL